MVLIIKFEATSGITGRRYNVAVTSSEKNHYDQNLQNSNGITF